MTPGGALVIYQISSTMEYTVGIHADQPLGTEIKVMAYDGNTSQEAYVIPDFTVPK